MGSPVCVDVIGSAHEMRKVVDVFETPLGEHGPLGVGPGDVWQAWFETRPDPVDVRREKSPQIGHYVTDRRVVPGKNMLLIVIGIYEFEVLQLPKY